MKRILKIAGISLLYCFVILVVTEISLGIFFRIKDRHTTPLDAVDFPYLYFLINQAGSLNEYGMKTDVVMQKDSSVYRIILIGGSVTRGNEPENSIASFLERTLNDSLPGRKIEVLNAGMSAYVAEQEFLFLQLILQHYQPDMVIDLSGFNDLYSYQANRPFEKKWYPFPQNWQQLKVVEKGILEKQFAHRFSAAFSNISRAVSSFRSRRILSRFDWTSLSTAELEQVSSSYWNIVDDMSNFCKAKGISFLHFLQPVRDFHTSDRTFIFSNPKLNELYQLMNEQTGQWSYSISMADIFSNQPQRFTDFCHLTTEANEIVAEQIAKEVLPAMNVKPQLPDDQL